MGIKNKCVAFIWGFASSLKQFDKQAIRRLMGCVIVNHSRFSYPKYPANIFLLLISGLKVLAGHRKKYSPFMIIIIMRPKASLTCC